MTFSPTATSDDHGAGPLRRGRRRDRAVAGGADRRELQGHAAGDGGGRAGFGARRCRRAGVRDRRRSRHLHRLAPGLRNSDRRFGHCFLAELPSQVRSRAGPRCRSTWSASLLAAAAIILISFGFNNLNRWGLGLATARTRRSISLGLSPAPILIVVGIVLGQAFLMWTHRRQAAGKTPLLALEVIDSPQERAAVYACSRSSRWRRRSISRCRSTSRSCRAARRIATAIAMMPFNLTVFFTAMLIVRFYDRLTPRQIGRYGFMLCTVALLWLAFVVRNDWSAVPVLFGLVLFGIGQGALVTLLFNVLVTASPKELAGDVGSLRGTTQNLAAAVGTAVAGALLVGLLSAIVLSSIAASPKLHAGASGAGRSRQHQLRQQRPAAGACWPTTTRHPGAGRRSGARQYRGAAACVEDRAADHGRRWHCWRSFPAGSSAELPAGRNSGRPSTGRKGVTSFHRSAKGA